MAKVLVVEDDMMLSEVLQRSLQAAQIETHIAHDGFEAEIEIKSWHPDMVLLDLLMPNKDGITVLRETRADSETHNTKFMVLSNLSEDRTIAEVKKFGVTDYLVKAETNPGEVVAKVKERLQIA